MIDPYERLDRRVQQWIFRQGWSDLREIQRLAIEPILAGATDVLISASTAAGKTEAAFLPALSSLAQEPPSGFGILYISPLKALINDQNRRLELLCEMLELRLTPWHGDAPASGKRRARAQPSGVLLITPESLESLMVRDAGWVAKSFAGLRYVVIDEFHAFIGTERGQQLLSLLNRLEHLLGRQQRMIPRLALSATLGALETVPHALRPHGKWPCKIITSRDQYSTLQVQVQGYEEQPPPENDSEEHETAEERICKAIYSLCRGDSHLVFANSRNRTESLAAALHDLCVAQHVPNEFFPHHGSLSKELRESLESRLQKEALPTTALCTMTLELGIDIGKVKSVVQVNAPPSVASLRQRLGRSGRRMEPSILRMMITEEALSDRSHILDELRTELVQSLAMIRLLIIKQWFEPAETRQLHLSTLVHQILAVTAQWGGVRADQLFALLCRTGPFHQVDEATFSQLLRHLGSQEILQQLGSGELVLGRGGERLVDHYTFYSVFTTPEEFRIVAGAKTLGSLPVDTMVVPGEHIIFAGRRWQILNVDVEGKVIQVKPTKGGKPPKFSGTGALLHDEIRQEMLRIYQSGDYRIEIGNRKVDFADSLALHLFEQGAGAFHRFDLANRYLVGLGQNTAILPWLGDRIVNTLALLLVQQGFQADHYGGCIEVRHCSPDEVADAFATILRQEPPDESELAVLVAEKRIEKFDYLLPEALLGWGYGARMFDVAGALEWLRSWVRV